MLDFRIACTLLNASGSPLKSDNEARAVISSEMLNRLKKPNLLFKLVLNEKLNRRSANFQKISGDLLSGFPVLSKAGLYAIALGTYQLEQAKSCYAEYLNEN